MLFPLRDVRRPQIGEIWCDKGASPWDTDRRVTVVDLKDGWVRYEFLGAVNKCALTESDFLHIYRPDR